MVEAQVEKRYFCVYPCLGRQVLLGFRVSGFSAGKYDGFGAKLEDMEAVFRELKGHVRKAEIEVRFPEKQTRHHIFTWPVGSASEAEESELCRGASLRWFDICNLPFPDMWPDLAGWLPQVLAAPAGLEFQGSFEIGPDARLTASRLRPSELSIPGLRVPAAPDFELELEGSKEHFDLAWHWSWALLGACAFPRGQGFKRACTADSQNRLLDKAWVESQLGLTEIGDETRFFDGCGSLVAEGYHAIVYGDHGPYVEFTEGQIHWRAFPKHVLKGPARTHFQHHNADGSVKLYDQINKVSEHNPPAGRRSVANNRAGGYADYQPGYLYIAIDEFVACGGIVHRAVAIASASVTEAQS